MGSQDTRPKVDRVGFALGDIRNRAVAQILMDHLIHAQAQAEIHSEFDFMLAAYGCAGLCGHTLSVPVAGLVGDLEVVHGTELMPFPSQYGMSRTGGLMRRRWVPESFLKDVYGTRRFNKMLDSGVYRGRKIQYGAALDQINANHQTNSLTRENASDDLRIFEIVEVWNVGLADRLRQYGVVCGKYTLEAYDFTEEEVFCPIAKATFYNNGTFHGMGHFQMTFGAHRATERLLKNLYQNVEELDRYPLLVLPQGSYNGRTAFQDAGGGVKIMKYMPDAFIENFKPFPIEPVNNVLMPAQVAEFSRNISRELNPVRDLLAEKGRAESGEALQLLDEQTKQATVHATQQKRTAYGKAYRAVAQAAVREILTSPIALRPSRLTLDMAGVVIDPETDSVQFTENPIPNIAGLTFTIMDSHPQSTLARKVEATNHLREQRMTNEEYRLFMVQEGLDPAMPLEAYENAVEMSTRNCLLLYGDGEFPGQVIITPDTVRPDIQLMIVTTFLSSLAVSKASPAVQDAITDYKAALTEFGGFALPEQVPAGLI